MVETSEVIGRELYARHPEAPESALTLMRAKLVKKGALAAHAKALELAPTLRLGPGEQKSGGHRRDSILADVVEALIGAVLLDGGAEAAEGERESRRDSLRDECREG